MPTCGPGPRPAKRRSSGVPRALPRPNGLQSNGHPREREWPQGLPGGAQRYRALTADQLVFRAGVGAAVHRSMRALFQSATSTSPEGKTSTSLGVYISARPAPSEPNVPSRAPDDVNTWIRLLPVSETYM